MCEYLQSVNTMNMISLNNDSAITECPKSLSADQLHNIQTIEWWFNSILHITISVVGLVANLVSIPVLLSDRMTNVFYRTLACLAIFDFLYIGCDVLEVIRRGYKYSVCQGMPIYQIAHYYLFPKFLRPIQHIMMVASIYTTVVVTLERYFAVSKPIIAMIHSGKGRWKTVMAYVLPVSIFSVVFKLPIFFEFFTQWCYSSCNNPRTHTYCDNDVHGGTNVDLGQAYNATLGKFAKLLFSSMAKNNYINVELSKSHSKGITFINFRYLRSQS